MLPLGQNNESLLTGVFRETSSKPPRSQHTPASRRTHTLPTPYRPDLQATLSGGLVCRNDRPRQATGSRRVVRPAAWATTSTN